MSDAGYEQLQQAADWYARLFDGETGEAEQVAWREWLERRPEHRQAWAVVSRVGERFAPFRQGEGSGAAFDALQTPARTPLGRRRVLLSLGLLAVGSALAWRGTRDTVLGEHLQAALADQSTAVGERRELGLPDGGKLWLNSLSAVDLAYTGVQRRLDLRAGEILLQVPRDARGPLRVATELGWVKSAQATLGICLLPDGLCLSVFDGQATLQDLRGTRRLVEAGNQLQLTSAGFGALQAAEPARRSWVQGVFVADGTPLWRLVEDLGRQRHGYLGCSPEVANLKLVGSFPLADSDRALEPLPQVLPVRISRPLPWWVSIEARA